MAAIGDSEDFFAGSSNNSIYESAEDVYEKLYGSTNSGLRDAFEKARGDFSPKPLENTKKCGDEAEAILSEDLEASKTVVEETADLVAEGQQAPKESVSAQDQHIASELAALFGGQQAALNRNAAQVCSGAAQDSRESTLSILSVTANMCRGNHV